MALYIIEGTPLMCIISIAFDLIINMYFQLNTVISPRIILQQAPLLLTSSWSASKNSVVLYCLGLKKDVRDCCLGPVEEEDAALADLLSMVVVLVDFLNAGVGTAAGAAGLLTTGDGADCWNAATGVGVALIGVSSSSSSSSTFLATIVLAGCAEWSDGWGVEAAAPPYVPITVLPPHVGVALEGSGGSGGGPARSIALDRNRRTQVSVTIVRLLKKESPMPHSVLLEWTQSILLHHFSLTVEDFKREVETLIGKQFVARVEGASVPSYKYTA